MARIRNVKPERTRYPGVWRKPSGRFEARWSIDGHKYGRTFDTVNEACSYRRKMLEDVERGTAVIPTRSSKTFGEYAEEWMAGKHDIEPTTKAGYRSYLNARLLPAFRSRSLGKITRADVKRFVAGLVDDELAPETIGKVYRLLRQILAEAIEDNYIAVNPAQGVKVPRIKKVERQYLSAAEVGVLADEFRHQYRALIYVLAYGGLRFGEAVALRRKDCDLLRRRLNVSRNAISVSGRVSFTDTKTHAARPVSLPTFVVEELARHLETIPDESDALVFTSATGKPLRYPNFRRNDWNRSTEAAGFGVWRVGEDEVKRWTGLTPHELRHTCAALLIATGANPKQIQAHLGHSSIKVTLDTYGHLFDGHMDDAMDLLDQGHREASAVTDNVRRIS